MRPEQPIWSHYIWWFVLRILTVERMTPCVSKLSQISAMQQVTGQHWLSETAQHHDNGQHAIKKYVSLDTMHYSEQKMIVINYNNYSEIWCHWELIGSPHRWLFLDQHQQHPAPLLWLWLPHQVVGLPVQLLLLFFSRNLFGPLDASEIRRQLSILLQQRTSKVMDFRQYIPLIQPEIQDWTTLTKYLLGMNKKRRAVLVHKLIAAIGVNMSHFCAVNVERHPLLINPQSSRIHGRTSAQDLPERSQSHVWASN